MNKLEKNPASLAQTISMRDLTQINLLGMSRLEDVIYYQTQCIPIA